MHGQNHEGEPANDGGIAAGDKNEGMRLSQFLRVTRGT